jgi:hypothetical protein
LIGKIPALVLERIRNALALWGQHNGDAGLWIGVYHQHLLCLKAGQGLCKHHNDGGLSHASLRAEHRNNLAHRDPSHAGPSGIFAFTSAAGSYSTSVAILRGGRRGGGPFQTGFWGRLLGSSKAPQHLMERLFGRLFEIVEYSAEFWKLQPSLFLLKFEFAEGSAH